MAVRVPSARRHGDRKASVHSGLALCERLGRDTGTEGASQTAADRTALRSGRARRVPVNRVTHGDSRSFITEQPALSLTCAAAGPAGAATSFASRGRVRVLPAPPGKTPEDD